MNSIRKHIELLYPTTVEECMQGIRMLTEHYKNSIRKESPELTSRDIIMISYADSFQQKGLSPLQGLKKVMDTYLSDSLNSLHILPFYPFSSDDGFSVVDYKKVKQSFGDWDDIEALGQSYHLMFDAVVNHISKSSEWFQGFLNGNEEYKDFFIVENPENAELKKVVRPRTLPLLHPFIVEDQKQFVWTTFSEDQVDLNYANFRVFLRVLDVLLFYIANNARLIRLDAIAFLWKKLGTDCSHLPETHLIIKIYRAIIEQLAPQTLFITETNVPHFENISYFGDGFDEAHMVYNFSLPPLLAYSIHKQEVSVLTQWAKSLSLPSKKTCFFNFTASHDGVGLRPLQGLVADNEIHALAQIAENHGGFVSRKSNPDGSISPYELNCSYIDLITHPDEIDELRARRFMLTQSLMLCMPGVPAPYFHSIFGSRNDRQAALSSGINRRINRAKINLERLEEELQDKSNLRSIIYKAYNQLLKTRSNERAFYPYGDAEFFEEGPLFLVERRHGGEKLLCIHNFSSALNNIEDHLFGKQFITDESVLVDGQLKPYAFIWLKF